MITSLAIWFLKVNGSSAKVRECMEIKMQMVIDVESFTATSSEVHDRNKNIYHTIFHIFCLYSYELWREN